MKTYEDFQKAGNKPEFIIEAIADYQSSEFYHEARDAYEYFKKRNVTILEFRKWLYKLTGEKVPDSISANHKFVNAFFPIFVRQENSHLLGNGITFEGKDTKDRLGGDTFDDVLIELGEDALWGGVAFGFWNFDHVDVFKALEFVPLWGEEDGALHAGIRYWQIAPDKPLRATLYEEDGYTEYIWRKGTDAEILAEKRTYQQIVRQSVADGVEIADGENYQGFPIVPLWANREHQSEITGIRSKIDGYDLIQSGFANDLDDASQIFWVIKNAGGMDDMDLVKFIERMKTVRAATVDEDGSTAEAHTIEVPYAAREAALKDIRDSLYRDAMALDTDKITAGNITATAIESSYENLTLKVDGYESCVTTFIQGILKLIGIKDSPTYKRSKIINMAEDTQMVLSAAQYLDDETILKHLPFLSPDEIDGILTRKDEEEAERYESDESGSEGGQGKAEADAGTEGNPEANRTSQRVRDE